MIEQQQEEARWPTAAFIAGILATSALVGLAIGGGDGSKMAWFTSRAAGVTAYLLLALSSIWGLLTSSRILSRWMKPPITLELHKVFSFVGIAAMAVHGLGLLFDNYITYNFWQISVPFLSEYRPVAVASGVFAGYLMVILSVSFYVKKQIGGPAVWRMLHYSAFAAFALGALHGIFAGTDSGSPWMIGVYATSLTLVLFLTYVRILGGRYIPRRRERHAPVSNEPSLWHVETPSDALLFRRRPDGSEGS